MCDLRLHLYCDADFAGCQTTNRCTSGVFLAIEGPRSFFPVGAGSKKQHVTSTSTGEAESCSGSYGLRQVGLPGAIIWDVMMGFTNIEGLKDIFDEERSAGKTKGVSGSSGTSPSAVVPSVPRGLSARRLHLMRSSLANVISPTDSPLQRTTCCKSYIGMETTQPKSLHIVVPTPPCVT